MQVGGVLTSLSLPFRGPWLLALLLAACLAAMPAAALAASRWALVVGVKDYADGALPRLDNPLNDAQTIASALNGLGFKIYYVANPDRQRVFDTIREMARTESSADVGLVYYAGHGFQQGGHNYLLPVDFSIAAGTRSAIALDEIIDAVGTLGANSLAIILDTCRTPLTTANPAFGPGLALTRAPRNTLVAYATSPNDYASDGDGANGPFAAALASLLHGGQQDLEDVLRLVRIKVRWATGGKQTPWYVDEGEGRIPLGSRRQVSVPAVPEALLQQISLPVTFWKTIASSSDPRDFDAFARNFPDHPIAEEARRQAALLRADQAPEFPLMDLGIPRRDPEVPGGLLSIITACDILVTPPGESLGLAAPVPQSLVNTHEALRACLIAVAQDPENARLLGLLGRALLLADRYQEALHYLERAGALGNATAYGKISLIHRLGLGVPKDLVRAAEAARAGAMMGSPVMCLTLGMHYREGWGVPQSFEEALRWMEVAARTGNASALTALGDLYRRGQGLREPDFATALRYYKAAAAQGQTDAMNLIGLAYMKGEGVAKDEAKGIDYLSEASDLGNPYAAFHLGRAHLTGWGVRPDPEAALAYFRLSADRRYLGAYNFVGDLTLAGGETDPARIREAYANYAIAREAALARDTIEAIDELNDAKGRLAQLASQMSPEEIAAAEHLARDWIEQNGLLDFELVYEQP